jgi:hypothetical protein
MHVFGFAVELGQLAPESAHTSRMIGYIRSLCAALITGAGTWS